MTEWISIKDRVPEDHKMVLAYQVFAPEIGLPSGIKVMHRIGDSWYGPGFGRVSHWMELPPAPETPCT